MDFFGRLYSYTVVADSGMISRANCALLTQKLQQDVKEFRNSFLVLLQSCQAEYQSCLSDVTAVVQRAELSGKALQGESMAQYTLRNLCGQCPAWGPSPVSFYS